MFYPHRMEENHPIFVAVYPHIAKIARIARDAAIQTLRKIFVLTALLSFVVFTGIFIFAGPIVNIVLGPKFEPSITIIRILSPIAFVVPVAFIFANLGLLPFNLDRYFARIYIFGGVLNIVLLLTLLYAFEQGAAGAAFSILLTQVTITTLMYVVLRRNKIKIVNIDLSSLVTLFQRGAITRNGASV